MFWYISAFVLFWLLCGVVSYGINFSYFQRAYPELAHEDYWHDMRVCLLLALYGPISLLLCLLDKRRPFYGLKFF